MSADTLIRKALDAGVQLMFVDGKLKAVGKTQVVRAWANEFRTHKAALIQALQPQPKPTDWRGPDRAYQNHHVTCPTCIAAGKGYGLRCGTGQTLWSIYETALEGKQP